MTAPLAGKVCLVTGASRGIGAAIAADLAAKGATVAVHFGHDADAAEHVAASLPGSGHHVFGADLAEPAAAESLVDAVTETAGGLDVLVNNAGIFESHPPLEVDGAAWLAAWEKTLAVNLLSPAVLCRAAARFMAGRGGGRIVNVGSRGAFRGEPDCPAYGASKAGLHSMSQSLAVALAPCGILVYAVAPGFVETEMAAATLAGEAGDAIRAQSPLGRVARPEEVAEVVGFLAASEGACLTGSIVDVNGASYLRH